MFPHRALVERLMLGCLTLSFLGDHRLAGQGCSSLTSKGKAMPELADLVKQTMGDIHMLADKVTEAANDETKPDTERACSVYNLLDDFEQKVHSRRAAIRRHCKEGRIADA
jgi:hypothetical protein